jgi:sec-independent protein translocase protein TatA
MNVMIAGFLGGWEWLIVILAVLLLFGAKRIPELAKGLGSGIKEFKKAAKEVTDEVQNAANDTPPAKPITNSQSQPPVSTVSQTSNPPKA